jgi:hypothetical protein
VSPAVPSLTLLFFKGGDALIKKLDEARSATAKDTNSRLKKLT